VPQKLVGRDRVPARLKKDVQYFTLGIDGSPQAVLPTIDLEEDFINMPRGGGVLPLHSHPLCEGLTEFQTPSTDGFIRNVNAALCQDLFDVTKTERISIIETDGGLYN